MTSLNVFKIKPLRLLGTGFLSAGLGVGLVLASAQAYLLLAPICYAIDFFGCVWGTRIVIWMGLALVLGGVVLLAGGVVQGIRKGWAW